MTDFDADEPVAPLNVKKARREIFTDRLLSGGGVVLALTAAFFPWYVFFNEDKFTLRHSEDLLRPYLPENPNRTIVNKTDADIAGMSKTEPVAKPSDDQIVTGSIPQAGLPDSLKGLGDNNLSQPFPTTPSAFHLMHAMAGRAMIESADGIFLVKVGSELPDKSKVATLELRNGQWVIITDQGSVYDSNGKQK
jgi:hypothetical protein